MEKQTSSSDTRIFATTHWSVVLAAQDNDPIRAHEAIERLCHSFWYPLYSFL